MSDEYCNDKQTLRLLLCWEYYVRRLDEFYFIARYFVRLSKSGA